MLHMQESGALVQALGAACEASGLQAVPALTSKCVQLQETVAVRFGVMLIGPAGMYLDTCECAGCLSLISICSAFRCADSCCKSRAECT